MPTPHHNVDPTQRVGKRFLSIPSTLLRTGLPLLALVFAFAACDSDDSNGGSDGDFDLALYTGAAYEGTVTLIATPPGEEPETEELDVSVEVEDLGDNQARLTFFVAWTTPMELVYEGPYDEDGASLTFLSGEGDLQMDIDAEGEINGGGSAETRSGGMGEYSVEGSITASSLFLTFEGDVTEGDDEFPVGTEIALVFDLSR